MSIFNYGIEKKICLPFFSLMCVSSMSAQDKPNIILFIVDDMGLMDTSVAFDTDSTGKPLRHPLNDWYRTPNMERLSERGIRFSTFYAQSVSSPSRVSLMTGQNATRHATTNWIDPYSNNRNHWGPSKWNWKGLNSSYYTLPRMLHDAGYKTIHVGKAHFGCNSSEGKEPEKIGFDVNIAGSSIGHPGSYLGEDGYGHIKGYKSNAVPDLEKYHGSDIFLTEALTREAISEMEKATDEKKPFYLNMAHYAVHGPFMTDKRFIGHYTDSDKSQEAKAYATLVEGMDKSLGDILDYLERKGIAENTLIVFLGDNGGDAPLGSCRGYSSSAPFRGMKGAEFEGGMRVPFIVSWAKPRRRNAFQKAFPIKSGAVQTQLGTIMDIYPTMASLTGATIRPDHKVDGRNIRSLLQGEKDTSLENSFLMHFPHSHRGCYFTMYREDDWKLIYYYNPEHPENPNCVLYNLKEDPYEHEEVSFLNPEKTLYMLEKMNSRLQEEGALYPIGMDLREHPVDMPYFRKRLQKQ